MVIDYRAGHRPDSMSPLVAAASTGRSLQSACSSPSRGTRVAALLPRGEIGPNHRPRTAGLPDRIVRSLARAYPIGARDRTYSPTRLCSLRLRLHSQRSGRQQPKAAWAGRLRRVDRFRRALPGLQPAGRYARIVVQQDGVATLRSFWPAVTRTAESDIVLVAQDFYLGKRAAACCMLGALPPSSTTTTRIGQSLPHRDSKQSSKTGAR